jgi:hypothetical protein
MWPDGADEPDHGRFVGEDAQLGQDEYDLLLVVIGSSPGGEDSSTVVVMAGSIKDGVRA